MPWHRAYIKDFDSALREKCGYTGAQPYWDWRLGIILARRSHTVALTSFMADASNFQNSSFWNPNTTNGVGGWGDPNDDYQITDGGFAEGFSVSYPSPHRVRRVYSPNYEGQTIPWYILISPESQAAMVNGFVGDFIGFQAVFQGGSHAAIHRLVGGCVSTS